MFIKGSTVRGQELINRAANWEGTDLWDVYGRVSQAKRNAYDKCREWCYKSNGEHFRIISHNSFQFSVAWECVVEYVNPKTGEITDEKVTRIETANSTYIVLLNR